MAPEPQPSCSFLTLSPVIHYIPVLFVKKKKKKGHVVKSNTQLQEASSTGWIVLFSFIFYQLLHFVQQKKTTTYMAVLYTMYTLTQLCEKFCKYFCKLFLHRHL